MNGTYWPWRRGALVSGALLACGRIRRHPPSCTRAADVEGATERPEKGAAQTRPEPTLVKNLTSSIFSCQSGGQANSGIRPPDPSVPRQRSAHGRILAKRSQPFLLPPPPHSIIYLEVCETYTTAVVETALITARLRLWRRFYEYEEIKAGSS